MTIRYFVGCADIQSLKTRYRELAKAHHPDLHPEEGDEVMKAINAEYDEMVKRFSRVAPDGRTEATAEQARSAEDMATAYREAVYKIIHLDGLEIELCGAWLWVGGDTYKHRDALKAAGYRWASKKQMWYWRPEEAACGHSRRRQDMDDIRAKYGSERVAGSYRYALAQ